MGDDVQQLKLLAIFHYVVAAVLAVVACFPVIHLIFGLMMVLAPAKMGGGPGAPPPPLFLGWMFILGASAFILFGWSLAVCIALSGRYLAQRRRRMFCLVIVAMECLWTPFGTVLGIFTVIVLIRPSVIELFEERQRLDAPAAAAAPGAPAPPPAVGADVRITTEGDPDADW